MVSFHGMHDGFLHQHRSRRRMSAELPAKKEESANINIG